MNKKRSLLMGLSLLAIGISIATSPLVFTGCVSLPAGTNAPPLLDPVKIGKDVKVVARMGAREVLRLDPNSRPYLEVVYRTLQSFMGNQNFDPAALERALASASAKELRNPAVAQGIVDALEIIKNHAADIIEHRLANGTPYAIPILQGFQDGIGEALGYTSPGMIPPPPIPTR